MIDIHAERIECISFFKKISKLSNLTSFIRGALKSPQHIASFGKFHRIGGAPTMTIPNVQYNAPEEVGGDRIFFDSPIRK